jgi:hypothetical protein
MSSRDTQLTQYTLEQGYTYMHEVVDLLICTYDKATSLNIHNNRGELMQYLKKKWDVEICNAVIKRLTYFSDQLNNHKKSLLRGSPDILQLANDKLLVDRVINIFNRMQRAEFSHDILTKFIEEFKCKKLVDALDSISVPTHTPSNSPSNSKKKLKASTD